METQARERARFDVAMATQAARQCPSYASRDGEHEWRFIATRRTDEGVRITSYTCRHCPAQYAGTGDGDAPGRSMNSGRFGQRASRQSVKP